MTHVMSDNEILMELRNMLHSDIPLPADAVNRMVLSALLNIDRRMSDLDHRVEGVEKLTPVVRVMLWVGAAIGASIVGLIWSLITGQAAIVFGGLP